MATAEVDIDALQPVQWDWRGGVEDLGTKEAYDQWWAIHWPVPLIDLDQDALIKRQGIGP